MDIQRYKTFENKKKDTQLISAFPGCGKSHFFRECSGLKESVEPNNTVLDSDSSTFDKKDFPENYIKHIKENVGKADIILISSHKEVRDALVENNLDFTLVYPDKSIKEEYLGRYEERGSDENFRKLLDKNWDMWLKELDEQEGCEKITLKEGQYLSDVL